MTARCARCDWRGEDDEAEEHARETGHLRCVICERRFLTEHEPQTCARCVAQVRTDLADIVYGMSILEPAAYSQTSGPTDSARTDEDPLLGGDAVVLDGPGGTIWRTADSRTGNREHKADNWPTDTPSVLFELAAWEDDWRLTYREPAASSPTLTSVVGYLTGNLDTGHRAAQTSPSFDEFAARVRKLAAAVNRVTRHRPEVSVERRTCVNCDGDLERVVYDLDRPLPARLQAAKDRIAADDEILARKPDAQVPERRDVVRRELTGDPKDGRMQQWVCRRCHAEYDREQFWNAVRARLERDREAG